MIRINSDPQSGGDVYIPTHSLTAFFPVGVSVEPVTHALKEAGFAEEHIQVFTGQPGAAPVEADGRKHGLWFRFMRSLEKTFSEEFHEFSKADQVLKSGGTVLAVYIGKDGEKKQRAAEILVARGGKDVMYWGPWAREYFSVGSVPLPDSRTRDAVLRAAMERGLQTEEELAARYHAQAKEADVIGLSAWKDKLERMATEAGQHAHELRELLGKH